MEKNIRLSTPHSTRPRVLVIDDNVELLSILSKLLAANGIPADMAASGILGLQMLTGTPGKYGLVLLDIQMPDMDGYEVMRRIRAEPHPETNTVKVIAMSGGIRANAAGFDAFLQKPFPFDRLIFTVKELLSKGNRRE